MTTPENSEQLLELLDSIAEDLEDVSDRLSEPPGVSFEELISVAPPALEPEPEPAEPVERIAAFAGLSAARRVYPDPPPRHDPAPRVRGTASQILSGFKWV